MEHLMGPAEHTVDTTRCRPTTSAEHWSIHGDRSRRASLSELERQAERTRADLIHTVDELHNRVSPQAIKQEMRVYAREASQDLIHNLERRARENPLQTVAVAAGLAYPAWRFITNIPAPILLIGAGLALSQVGARSPRAVSGDQGGEPLTEKVRRTVQDASSQVADRFDSVKERAAAAASEAAATVRSRVSELSEQAGALINDASASARHTAAESLAAVRETLSGTYQAGAQAAAHTGEQLAQSKETLTQIMENHPFVVGGIGLIVGAVVASALPVSQDENRLFGDNSEHLKNRARDVPQKGSTSPQPPRDRFTRSRRHGCRSRVLAPPASAISSRTSVTR
jgi:ElaB/YqjD/DUF883 family membrane-anchored ribosome-binding protein